MTLVVYGYNHKTAPIQQRERACAIFADIDNTLRQLIELPALEEALVLTTCNRIEIYCITEDPDSVHHWIAGQHTAHDNPAETYQYCRQDEAAVKHILNVACGLDSMVIGEPQILGQMKAAYQSAKQSGALGKQLSRLMETVFATAKAIRHRTGLNQYPVSMAYAAFLTLQKHMGDLAHKPVLVIGAGSTSQLLLQYLTKYKADILLSNRTMESAQTLLEQHNARYVQLDAVGSALDRVSAVISATSASTTIVNIEDIEAADIVPQLWIDLAVPRDIDAKIGSLKQCSLYNVDDMQALLSTNWEKRQQAAEYAQQLISHYTGYCFGQLRALQAGGTIKNYRQQINALKEQELEQALHMIDQGKPPKEVLNQFAHRVTQKILHTPSRRMRQAAHAGEHDYLRYAKQILDIDD